MRDVSKQRWILLAGGLAAVLLLAACGGGSHSAAATTNNNGTAAGSNASSPGGRLSAFRTCMANHGVTLPQRNRNRTPGTGGSEGSTPNSFSGGGGGGGFGGGLANRFNTPPAGVDPTKWQNALNACRSQLPTGGSFNSSAFQAFRSCLSDHGVTMPANGGFAGINRNDPKFVSAMTICRPLLPNGGNGPTTTTKPSSA